MNIRDLTLVIYAGALGDAFGYAIEFDSWRKIQDEFGDDGLQTWPFNRQKQLIVSDDTQMSLFAIDAISNAITTGPLHRTLLLDESKAAFLQWFKTQQGNFEFGHNGLLAYESLWARRAPGITCLSALSSHARQTPPVNGSKGCGAIMRAAPYAYLATASPDNLAIEASLDQGKLTHLHVDGYMSGAAFVYMLSRNPKNRTDLKNAALSAIELCNKYGAHGCIRAITLALENSEVDFNPEQINKTLGEGWVGDEALGIALWTAMRTTSVTHAITVAANHSGDSDSTASLAAQLAACLHGLSSNEIATAKKLDVFDAIEHALAKLDKASSTFGNSLARDHDLVKKY